MTTQTRGETRPSQDASGPTFWITGALIGGERVEVGAMSCRRSNFSDNSQHHGRVIFQVHGSRTASYSLYPNPSLT